MLDEHTPPTDEQQYRGSFQELADARRVLKVTNTIRQAPVLAVEDRLEVERIRAYAIRCIEAATIELIETLDIALGDPDEEANGDELDGNASEDDFMDHSVCDPGASCPVADPDSAVDDRPCDDINMDMEPEHDAEIETWGHFLDHPPELHIGARRGWNDDPEAA